MKWLSSLLVHLMFVDIVVITLIHKLILLMYRHNARFVQLIRLANRLTCYVVCCLLFIVASRLDSYQLYIVCIYCILHVVEVIRCQSIVSNDALFKLTDYWLFQSIISYYTCMERSDRNRAVLMKESPKPFPKSLKGEPVQRQQMIGTNFDIFPILSNDVIFFYSI